MKQFSILKKYGISTEYVLIIAGAIIISVFAIIFADRRSKVIETPTALEVMNISNNSVDIYWKSDDSAMQTVSYKRKNSSGTFDHSIDVTPELFDNNTNKYIYSVTIDGLDDNTDYTYRILSTNHVYGDYSFKTHKVADRIDLPIVYDGTSEKHRLIMVEVGEEKYMVDTEDHGTYAFNTDGKTPTLIEYANYTSNAVLAASNNSGKNMHVTLFGKQFSTQDNYENLAKLYTNSNQHRIYTQADIVAAIQKANNISSDMASNIARAVALSYLQLEGFGKYTTDERYSVPIFSLSKEGMELFNTFVGKMGQTLLLAAALNGCTSAADKACFESAGEDFGELRAKLTTILQKTTVSYLDVFGENGQFSGGSNENRATDGEQFVRTCYQQEHCETASCPGNPPVCTPGELKPGSGEFIKRIADPVSNADNEAYVDPTCMSETCLDIKQDCCEKEQSDGCYKDGTDTSKQFALKPIGGKYSCPQDFHDDTEHLLANGDTGYLTGTHYCYGQKVASKEDVQRGTPAVKFTGEEKITIDLDQTGNNSIEFTAGMMCVYDTLADFEKKFAYNDEFIADDALKGVGGGFADEKQYGPGEIATGEGVYTDSEGKKCPCSKGQTIPDDAQVPYYGGGTVGSTPICEECAKKKEKEPDLEIEDPDPDLIVDDDEEGDIGDDYYCNPNETKITVTDEAMRCSFEEGCACIYPEKTEYSDCFDCQKDSDVMYVCAVEGDSCNTDGTLSTWKYCYDNEEVIDIEDKDVKCKSKNGCACVSLSGQLQCAKKGEVCKADGGRTVVDDDVKYPSDIEVDSSTETDKKCKDKNGCTCSYTLPGESKKTTEISYGEVCSYPDGKKTDLSISSTSPSLDCIDKDGCTCTITASGKNKTIIEVEEGYTCTLDGKSEKTDNICCYYEGTLGMMSSTFCKNQASKNNKVKAFDDIEEDECTLVKVGMSFDKGNNFFEQFNVLESDTSTAKTAKELIKNTHHKIMTVANITSGKWSDLVRYDEENCDTKDHICGEDFELVPGSVYYVNVRTPFKYSANSLSKSIDLEDKYGSLTKNISGWNLLPSDIFLKDGKSSINILNNTANNIDQVAVWNNKLSSFEYTTRDALGEVYGSDQDLAKQVGVFVKINKK